MTSAPPNDPIVAEPDEVFRNALSTIKRDRLTGRCLWQGRLAFVKRSVPPSIRMPFYRPLWFLLRRRYAPDVVFQPVPYEKTELPVEVVRLNRLRQAGIAVPEVWMACREGFIIEDAGRAVQYFVAEENDAERRYEWCRLAVIDTVELHAKGQWHGGAQLRNLLVAADGTFRRIDFEWSIDRYLPVCILQALDVYLLFSSLADFMPDPEAMASLAHAYLDHATPQTMAVLRRGLPDLRRLAASRLLARFARKEHSRIAAAHKALHTAIQAK